MRRFRSIWLSAIAIFLLANLTAAQGGNAEPDRIDISNTPKMRVLISRLRNSQEKEYVFTAKRGESILIVNPNPSRFDVRIFHPESEFDTEYDSSTQFEVDIENDGDHILFIRRKVGGPQHASFRISIGKRPAERGRP